MSLSQYLHDWLTIRTPELKPRTIDSYRDLIDRYVIPAIGDADPEQLRADQISHMLAGIVAAGKTRTAELVFVMLRAALRDLDHDPMRRVRRPKHRQQRPEAWNDDQIAVYLQAISGHRHELAFSLAILCGLRRGEICGLRWEDIDMAAGIINIRNQRQRLADGRIIDQTPKSASSMRQIPIPAPLRPLLARRRALCGYVTKISPSGLDAAHRRLLASLSLPYIPLHGLRHTMATACVRHGGDLKCLQILLGHADYATTANIYTHPDTLMLQSCIACVIRA